MAEYIKRYPVHIGVGIGLLTSIGFYVMPPKSAQYQGCILIGMMGGSMFCFRF